MPGYVIHLAVAEEYLKKHGNKEKYKRRPLVASIISQNKIKSIKYSMTINLLVIGEVKFL